MSRDKFNQVAKSIPFDNSTNGFTATELQSAIEEIGASASPGFSFGRGSAGAGTWLNRVGEIPSNRAGVTIGINNPLITNVYTSTEDLQTYTLGVYQHDGNSINLSLLGTVSVTNARVGNFQVSFTATKGKQLAVKVISATASINNIGVDLILKGNA